MKDDIVDGATSIVREGGTEGSADVCVKSICEPLRGGDELWFEGFDGRKVRAGILVARGGAAEDTMVGGETGIGVPFAGINMVEFKRLSGGIVDGKRFVAC